MILFLKVNQNCIFQTQINTYCIFKLWLDHAEADTFFCFTNLMSEIRDNFLKTLDKDIQFGIQGRINSLNNLLKLKDPELWQDLVIEKPFSKIFICSHYFFFFIFVILKEDKTLNPQYYSFRWLTLLLSQEFDLPDVLRLWDSLFSDPNRFEFLLYVCCGMLV